MITSVFGIALLSGSWAMAMALDAPTGLTCSVDEDSVYFDWDDVADAVKYSVDVELPVALDGDGAPDMIVELSFYRGLTQDVFPKYAYRHNVTCTQNLVQIQG